MTELKYLMKIEEEEIDQDDNCIKIISKNLPHHDIIKDWLENDWNKLDPIQWIAEDVRKIIASAKMNIFQNQDKETIAQIIIEPIPHTHWNKKRMNTVWEYLDTQMSDGWGEGIDYHSIPDHNNYRLRL